MPVTSIHLLYTAISLLPVAAVSGHHGNVTSRCGGGGAMFTCWLGVNLVVDTARWSVTWMASAWPLYSEQCDDGWPFDVRGCCCRCCITSSGPTTATACPYWL